MDELLKEVRALREEVAGFRQDLRNQARAAARALDYGTIHAIAGEPVSIRPLDPPVGEWPGAAA